MSEEMRRTIRTVSQVAVTLAVLAPVLVVELGLNTSAPIVGGILAVSAVITRLSNTGLVDALLPPALRRDAGRWL